MPVVKLPNDQYWIGDPAQVLSKPRLQELRASTRDGFHGVLRGCPFFLATAPGGAGEYVDEAQRRYVVGEDSVVAVISTRLIEVEAGRAAGHVRTGELSCFMLGGELHVGKGVHLDLNAPAWG